MFQAETIKLNRGSVEVKNNNRWLILGSFRPVEMFLGQLVRLRARAFLAAVRDMQSPTPLTRARGRLGYNAFSCEVKAAYKALELAYAAR